MLAIKLIFKHFFRFISIVANRLREFFKAMADSASWEEKQKEILDSIHYARRIQQSLLPTEKYINKNLKT